jgi:hypothetical protein
MLWVDRVANRRSQGFLTRNVSVENWGQTQKKETRGKKKERPVETDAAGGKADKNAAFPQRLGKLKPLSTVPTRPDGEAYTTL